MSRKEEDPQLAKKVEPQSRHLRIELIGPIASGKSTFAGLLGERWGVKPIPENFEGNPHLDPFYNSGEPQKYALASQMWFLLAKISQMKVCEGEFTEIFETGLKMDNLFSETLFKMDVLDSREIQLYREISKALEENAGIYPSDLHIVLNAPADILFERVKERGRGLESGVTQEYLGHLSASVSEWVLQNRGRFNILEIDSNYYNFARPDEVQGELLSRIESTLAQMLTGRGIGSDGKKLILPSFTPAPRMAGYDLPPGLPPKQKVFQ